MKKASKVLTLILVVALLAGVFASCAAFGKNTAKYRQSAALKVGDETVSVGKVLDTFNTYYNNYYAYINMGYLTTDGLMEMVMNSLYYQTEKIDAYKQTAGVYTDDSLKDFCYNAEYLKKNELAFVVQYVKYMVFTTLDTLVEDYAEKNYKLKDKESEDTSRDFPESDDLGGAETYAEYVYNKNFEDAEMETYVKNYYEGLISTDDFSVESYVYANETAAAKMLEDLNARVEDEKKITFAELKEWQENALTQYKKNVQGTYGFDLTQLLKNQMEDVVSSVIVAKYNLSVNGVIENGDISKTLKILSDNHKQLVDSDTAKFNTDGDFITFIEGLKEGDFIHSVPSEFTYIFVKNILVPFSDNQKAVLATLAKQLGTTDSDQYKAMRQELATKIKAEDFLSDKDADGNHATVENVFKLENGKLIINPECNAFADYLKGDGSVAAMTDKSQDETVIELMKQFNTDTAQHTAAYDYVVRVGETPSNYTAKWVSEFVDGANEVWDNGAGKKHYSLAVSEYGVHIIYYSDDVAAQEFDFSDKSKLTDPNSNEYKLFKTYFESQSTLLLGGAQTDLHKQYVDASKISKTKNFDRFLKDNKIKFDFEKSLSDEEDE